MNHSPANITTARARPSHDERRFAAARRHSLVVTSLKWVLPALAVAIVAGFVLRTTASGVFQAQEVAAEIGLGSGKLVMDAPVVRGFDDNNRPYDLTADTATQLVSTPKVVMLDEVNARVPVGTDGFADVMAKAGTYDSVGEKLELKERIEVRGMNGLDIDLTQASIDMKAGTLDSNAPVTVRRGKSSIDADTLKVRDGGKRIVFDGRVRMVVKREPAKAQPVAAKASPVIAVPTPTERAPAWVLTGKSGPFATFDRNADGGSNGGAIEGMTSFRTLD